MGDTGSKGEYFWVRPVRVEVIFSHLLPSLLGIPASAYAKKYKRSWKCISQTSLQCSMDVFPFLSAWKSLNMHPQFISPEPNISQTGRFVKGPSLINLIKYHQNRSTNVELYVVYLIMWLNLRFCSWNFCSQNYKFWTFYAYNNG